MSAAEIETTLKKAAAGAGAPPGSDAEFGKAGLALSDAGFDPTPAFAAALDGFADGRSGGFEVEAARRGSFEVGEGMGERLSALLAGPSICDLLAADCGEITVLSIDVPIVVVSMIAARRIGATVRLASGEAIPVIMREGVLVLSDGAFEALHHSGDMECRLSASDAVSSHRRPGAARPSVVDGRAWGRIVEIADRCLVSSSDESRLRDAGAGLIDED